MTEKPSKLTLFPSLLTKIFAKTLDNKLLFIKNLHKIPLNDIEYNIIMAEERIQQIRSEIRRLEDLNDDLDTLRRQGAGVRAKDLEQTAESLGFFRKKKQTGEPIYKRDGSGRTVSIPHHSKTIGKGLAIKIIKDLQAIIFDDLERLRYEEDELNNQRGKLNGRNGYRY